MTAFRRYLGGPSVIEDHHVIPFNDFRDHYASETCWCNPWRLDDEPRVLIHNAMDGREFTIEKGKVQ